MPASGNVPWVNGPSGSTPLEEDALNRIEQALADSISYNEADNRYLSQSEGDARLTAIEVAPAVTVNGSGITQAKRFVGYLPAPGPPTTGTYQFQDELIDSNQARWVCITSGTPGVWNPAGYGSTGQIPSEFQKGTYLNAGGPVTVGTTPSTLPVASTDGFPTSGTLLVGTGVPEGTAAVRTRVTYTGTTATTFTGCTTESGTAVTFADKTLVWKTASGLRAGALHVSNQIIADAGVDGRPHDLVLVAAFDPSEGHTRGDYDIVLTREAGSYGVLAIDLPVRFPRDVSFTDGSNNPLLTFAAGPATAEGYNNTPTPLPQGTAHLHATLVGGQGTSKNLVVRNSNADANSRIRLQNSAGTDRFTVSEAGPEVPNNVDLRFAGATPGQFASIVVTAGNTFTIRDVGSGGGRIINAAFTTNLLTWDDAGNFTFAGQVKVGTTTTAARPSAATAGAGASMYDTTLSRPIWSDGTAWRDAAGTVV